MRKCLFALAFIALALFLSGCSSNQPAPGLGIPQGQIGADPGDFERMPFDPNDVCPFECCSYEEKYYDKFCAQGLECVKNSCIESSSEAKPPAETPEVPETPEQPPAEEPAPEPQLPQTGFKTASRQSEIIFSRDIEGTAVNSAITVQNLSYSGRITFKVTGFLKETSPDSLEVSAYGNDRAFEFSNGKLEWSIDASETEVGDLCTYIRTLKSSGNEAIENLNIYYDSESPLPMEGYGLALTFSKSNWRYYNNPTVSLDGKLLILMDKTTSVKLNKPSAICSGLREDAASTVKETKPIELPLLLLTDDSQSSITGSSVVKEAFGDDPEATVVSGSQNVRFRGFSVVITSPPLESFGPNRDWDISWSINLPEK